MLSSITKASVPGWQPIESSGVDTACGAAGLTISRDRCTTSSGPNKVLSASARGPQNRELDAALQKMSRGLEALGCQDGLDSAMVQIMVAQSKQANEACSSAENAVKDNYEHMKYQTIQQRKVLEERREALENRSWWDKFVDLFKKVLDVGVAVAGACTGNPAAIAAAILKVSGLIVTETCKDSDAGKWTGFALSTGGALVGAFSDAEIGGAKRAADAAGGVVEGIGVYARGQCDHDVLDADADLQDIRARRREAENAAEQEREVIEFYVEAQSRCMRAASQILENNNRVSQLAAQ